MTMILEIDVEQFDKDSFLRDIRNKLRSVVGNNAGAYVVQPQDDEDRGLIITTIGIITFYKRCRAGCSTEVWVLRLIGDVHNIYTLISIINNYMSKVLSYDYGDTSACEYGQ